MSALETLITEFARLPGIGRKTAQRLAYYLLQQSRDRMTALAGALEVVAERVHPCKGCGQPTEDGTCTICRDPRRDVSILCVVEEPSAVAVLERRLQEGGVAEVILATNSSMEGEATATWLQQLLAPWTDVRVSRLARGLPVGGDLEYVDGVTLNHALTAREALR